MVVRTPRQSHMTQVEERKLLNQILEALEASTPKRWAWQAFAINALSFCVLTAIALFVIRTYSSTDWHVAVSLVAATFAGSMIGAVATWQLLCKNGDYIRQYIDAQKVRDRLAELGS